MKAVPENKAQYLTATDILGAADLEREEVEVPEWGGVVTVQGLTAGQRVTYSQYAMAETLPADIQGRLCSMTIVHQDGSPMFTEEDIDALSQKSPIALQRIVDVAMRLSGFGEETEKN